MKAQLSFLAIILALAAIATGCGKFSKLDTPSKSATPTGPIELKIKWTDGEHMLQDYDMTQTVVINLPGRPTPMTQNMDMGQKMSLDVVSNQPDGGHEVEMEFLSASVTTEMAGRKTHYDSEKNSSSTDPLAKVFGKMVGSKIQYYLDASNRVERVGGIEELGQRISGGGQQAAALKGIFTEDYFKQMMDSSRYLPTKPVQPGDTWPMKQDVSLGAALGTMSLDYTFTFTGWEMHGKRNCARIDFSGSIETSQKGGSSGPMGMSIDIQNGTSSGIFWFDPEFGVAVDTKMEQDMTMVMVIPARNQGQTQVMTNQLNQSLDIRLDSLN
jgi:hypothetical protein